MTDEEIINRYLTSVRFQKLTTSSVNSIDRNLADLLKNRVVIDVDLAEWGQNVLDVEGFDEKAAAMQAAIDRVRK